ncbi:uncharacterized protein L201_000986 [Kwoniella dendrophila CBS 6074]|uniref:Uncharacterized protein n=1 Tax=Kwoniella dendrophila CBS 6074 TaxID=1295534 RepID=A0AAX4JNJ8_9TREE
MTQIPIGAQLSPVDLPPPPPNADPREPSPTLTPRQRGSRTPQRSRSPLTSRDVSPVRPLGTGRLHSGELGSSPPPTGPTLYHPIPRSTSGTGGAGGGTPSSAVPVPIHSHHLSSRPSSPSSIHSSGSAIFERDIEFPPVSSLSLNPNPTHQQQQHTLNHKSSRLSHLSHGSTLDHTVPAVLDDAVEALTASNNIDENGLSRGFEGLEIEAPAPSITSAGTGTGMARQSSSSLPGMPPSRKVSLGPGGVGSSSGPISSGAAIHSRSPSPISVTSGTSSIASPATSPPILGQFNTQQAAGVTGGQISPTSGEHGLSATVPRPAMPQRISTGPQVPGGWAFGGAPAANASSAASQTAPVQNTIPESAVIAEERASSPSSDGSNNAFQALTPSSLPSHISPNKNNKHRISYLSYNDLLLSVPTKVTSLEDITSGNLSPDHLPGTISPSMSTRSPVMTPHNPISPNLGGSGILGDNSPNPAAILSGGSRSNSISTPPVVGAGPGKTLQPKSSFDGHRPTSLGGLGLGEGEWERQGLGKGLEQRLEEVAQNQN